MTMVSFRVDVHEEARMREWAERLGIDRSSLVRDAVRRHLNSLTAHREAAGWTDDADHDRAVDELAAIADWGPAEDWSDWHDAEG